MRDPDIYSGATQHALSTFYQQLALVFKTKPLTYGREEYKCSYPFVGFQAQR